VVWPQFTRAKALSRNFTQNSDFAVFGIFVRPQELSANSAIIEFVDDIDRLRLRNLTDVSREIHLAKCFWPLVINTQHIKCAEPQLSDLNI